MFQSILIALFFFSLFNFLIKIIDWISMPNQFHQILNQRTQLVENMRVDLIKQKIKADFFSLKYFLIINDKTGINIVHTDLKSIGVESSIYNDINKFNKFVNDIFSNKIKISFNQKTKKFIYK